jgi:hypothetical protein
MKSMIVIGAIGLGLSLFVASAVWATLFPPTRSWTPEKAERMSEVKARLNNLSFMINEPKNFHSGPDVGTLKAESDALLKEFEQLKTDFESATESPQTVATVLRWSGLSLAVLGVIGWYAVRQNT